MFSIAVALLPVIGFLTVLYTMDSFKLVPVRSVLGSVAAGGAAALISLWVWNALNLGFPSEWDARRSWHPMMLRSSKNC